MSLESAKQFIERAQRDDAFHDKVHQFKDEPEKGWEWARSEGYDFTKEEIRQVMKDMGLPDKW